MIGVGTRVRLVSGEETGGHGVQATSGQMKVIRTIGRNINLTKATLGSQETLAHGQIQDLRHGFNQIEGSIATEWSYGSHDMWLEGIMAGTWASNRLNMGTGVKTYTVERQFLDLGRYEVFKGVAMNTAEFRLQPEAIVGITWTPIGMAASIPSTSPIDASPAASATNQPFDTFTGAIYEGGAPIGLVTGLTFSIARGRTLGPVIGSKTSPDVFEGTGVLTGTMTAYFENHTLYTRFVNEAWSSLQFDLHDLDNPLTGYTGVMPRIKYMGSMKDPAREGPVIQEMPFQATYDVAEQTTFYLLRGTTLFT